MSSRIVQCGNCGGEEPPARGRGGRPHCGNCHQPLPWIAEAGRRRLRRGGRGSTMPVIVDFWAPGAGPAGWSARRSNRSPRTSPARSNSSRSTSTGRPSFRPLHDPRVPYADDAEWRASRGRAGGRRAGHRTASWVEGALASAGAAAGGEGGEMDAFTETPDHHGAFPRLSEGSSAGSPPTASAGPPGGRGPVSGGARAATSSSS